MFPDLNQYLGPVYFGLFALIALLCSIGLLVARHPIKGAICLIGVMLSLSGLYAILNSPFIAVLQVLVYAGAIMMLLVFVIMVLNQGEDHAVPRFDRSSVLTLALPVLVGVLAVATLVQAPIGGEDPAAARGTIQRISAAMFTVGRGSSGYYLLFEIGGLLLLAALVGAVLLAKRSLDRPAAEPEGAHPHGAMPHAHPGHADRGTAIASLHDQASAGATTVAADGAIDVPGTH
jgi:NADH-quinone oxidoreductase subunit J